MLSGVVKLEESAAKLPTISSFDIEPVDLSNVEIIQLQYELSASRIESLLPPALHPTLPPLGLWTCWSVADSPWGLFELVQFRLSCRSGARPRTLLLSAATNNEHAANSLAQWGLNCRVEEINFIRGYETAQFQVHQSSELTLSAEAQDPEPLTATDIQFFASMHPANTPNGLRLVQFDPTYEVQRAERYEPNLKHFNARAWGYEQAIPSYPVIAWGVNANIHLPQIRFVCRSDVTAFEGTEVVNRS